MATRAEVLNYYLRSISENEKLDDETKIYMGKALKAIADQFYKAGVKAGYLKILQDHRDGAIDLSTATPAELNRVIEAAQKGELMPGTDLSRRARHGSVK